MHITIIRYEYIVRYLYCLMTFSYISKCHCLLFFLCFDMRKSDFVTDSCGGPMQRESHKTGCKAIEKINEKELKKSSLWLSMGKTQKWLFGYPNQYSQAGEMRQPVSVRWDQRWWGTRRGTSYHQSTYTKVNIVVSWNIY